MDNNLSSKVEIFISAANLPNKDTFSKSDPLCIVSLRDPLSGAWKRVGQTERIQDNLNPVFKTPVTVEYHFEENQELRFDIIDIDKGGVVRSIDDHDFIGYYETTLGSLVSARSQRVTERLRKKDGRLRSVATITLRVEELTDNKDILHFTIEGEKLDKKDFFGKSDGFLQFFRSREDNTWVQVHQTEVVMKSLDPKWKPFQIPVAKFCNNDYKRPILVKCFDWNARSDPDFIGEFQTSLSELLTPGSTPAFHLTQPQHKKPEKRTKSYGRIIFRRAELIKQYSFLDFIRGGMQVGLMVAIDFTGSNGHPDDPSSLHYRRGAGPNAYQQAITTIGGIVAQYATTQRFPVWGFGAKVGHSVSHCFPLNFSSNPEVTGVDGILRAYNDAFPRLLLSGPTYFSEIIRTATSIASAPYTATTQHYSILLILTDGVINDMNETISAIVDASDRPLSIIIIGVGNANFSQMDTLDGDGKMLEFRGKRALRDIVQFVPMNKFSGQHISRLAAETLAEVPPQLLSFCKMHGVLPMKPTFAPMPTMTDFKASSHVSFIGSGPPAPLAGEMARLSLTPAPAPAPGPAGAAPYAYPPHAHAHAAPTGPTPVPMPLPPAYPPASAAAPPPHYPPGYPAPPAPAAAPLPPAPQPQPQLPPYQASPYDAAGPPPPPPAYQD